MFILFVLLSILLRQVEAAAPPKPVLIEYLVDVGQPGKKSFQVRATIDNLTDEQIVVLLPGLKADLPLHADRLSNIGLVSKDEGFVPLASEDGRILIQNSVEDHVVISYRLASGSFLRADRMSYLDEQRGLLHFQDILLEIEGQPTRSSVSFRAPKGWRVMATVSPDETGDFRVESGKVMSFYLGEAETERETIGRKEVHLAVEPNWPEPLSRMMDQLRGQLRYLQSVSRESRRDPLLAIFVAPSKPLQKTSVVSFGASQLLILSALRELPEVAQEEEIQRNLSVALVQSQFPVVKNLAETLSAQDLQEYLVLKTGLKTGWLTQSAFMEAMAKELWLALGTHAESAQDTQPTPAKLPSHRENVTVSPRQSYFLLDLVLAFYGESFDSVEDLLQTKPSEARQAQVSRGDFRKKLAQEDRANKILQRLWTEAQQATIDEILKPFGLLFERKELPGFPFELTETFHIAQIKKGMESFASGLQAGDRIVSINHCRLSSPEDLMKCGSQLVTEQEVQFLVERDGVSLKVKQRMAKEVLLKLDINKLADADKQEKLERFLSRYPEGT